MTTPSPDRSRNVFINCPFDEAYKPLFRALVFTILDCGFAARCSLEIDDSGETRFDKLIRLIRESPFGIHDISRTEPNAEDLPRFNMPYELGIFIGLRYSGARNQKDKQLLVFDREKYRYGKFLSDFAGKDIHSHNNDPYQLIKEVRNWLRNLPGAPALLGAVQLRRRFESFQAEIPVLVDELRITEADLDNYRDFHNLVTEWITQHPLR